MTSRPLVKVFSIKGEAAKETTSLPDVFSTPLRADIVHDVFTNINKNKRQPYAVSRHAGEQTSAESWGTGRAVARIPRVAGGGTHRAGQGAFGNMCRGGRMFAPTKIWRKWHRKVNVAQKRFAITSALAGTAIPSLVLARGHRIEEIAEVPLVVSGLDGVSKTKDAVSVLESLGAFADIEKVKNSHKIRTGRGKARNRRHVQRRGPLIIYEKKGTLVRAFRNIPGVDTVSVERLNLLSLAPGGHLGRFVIWTQDAFARLDTLYGTYATPSKEKKGFLLPRAKLTNADLSRIINSDEVQSHLRSKKRPERRATHKKNPLNNRGAMLKLNPFEGNRIRRQLKDEERRKAAKGKNVAERRKLAQKREKINKKRQTQRKALLANHFLYEGVEKKAAAAKIPESS